MQRMSWWMISLVVVGALLVVGALGFIFHKGFRDYLRGWWDDLTCREEQLDVTPEPAAAPAAKATAPAPAPAPATTTTTAHEQKCGWGWFGRRKSA